METMRLVRPWACRRVRHSGGREVTIPAGTVVRDVEWTTDGASVYAVVPFGDREYDVIGSVLDFGMEPI